MKEHAVKRTRQHQEEQFQKTPEKKRTFLSWLKYAALFLLILGISGILFLKLNTAAAAEFTDHVLRPLIGDSNVIFMEKIFFNAQDELQRLTTKQKNIEAPTFGDETANIAGGNLDLAPISIINKFQPLPGEGVWKNRPLKAFLGKEAMAVTFVRSDPDRPYSITTLAQIDKSLVNLGSVAGTEQPGGPVGKPGPGVVPKDIIDSGRLIAAFDGGFQYKDGQFGMIVGDTTYLPLKNDLGTLVGYKDGSLKIVDYKGQSLGNNIEFIRQNCPILVQDGNVAVSDPRNRQLWGRLVIGTVDIFTWRSGIGITKNGNIIFAVGNNLTPTTLANALKAGGAVNAIQLDINPIWVRFNIFDYLANGKYDSYTLTKDLQDGSKAYLDGYEKDFFYIYKK
ncbi:MAG TPA: phosphodiester glycosidase family protein [Patescibacteria group bacterium]